MDCKNCKYWQGTKYSEWGDCYRVVAELEPYLLDCYQTNEHGTVDKFFEVPFDPHDAKYWINNSSWKKLYKNAYWGPLPPGVKVIEETVNDVIFDSQNGERVGKLKLRYFRTHKEYECNVKS